MTNANDKKRKLSNIEVEEQPIRPHRQTVSPNRQWTPVKGGGGASGSDGGGGGGTHCRNCGGGIAFTDKFCSCGTKCPWNNS